MTRPADLLGAYKAAYARGRDSVIEAAIHEAYHLTTRGNLRDASALIRWARTQLKERDRNDHHVS